MLFLIPYLTLPYKTFLTLPYILPVDVGCLQSGGVYKINIPETDSTIAQLTKDLKDSLERENDLKEQLKFSEEENATMRKKLLEMEEETESMSLQLRKLSSAKSGRYTKVKAAGGDQGLDSEAAATERESELRLQMELAEQEVKVFKRKMDELQQVRTSGN